VQIINYFLKNPFDVIFFLYVIISIIIFLFKLISNNYQKIGFKSKLFNIFFEKKNKNISKNVLLNLTNLDKRLYEIIFKKKDYDKIKYIEIKFENLKFDFLKEYNNLIFVEYKAELVLVQWYCDYERYLDSLAEKGLKKIKLFFEDTNYLEFSDKEFANYIKEKKETLIKFVKDNLNAIYRKIDFNQNYVTKFSEIYKKHLLLMENSFEEIFYKAKELEEKYLNEVKDIEKQRQIIFDKYN